MRRDELAFERPQELFASIPPELRAGGRDDVRLMVSTPSGTEHARFLDLPQFLRRGDLLVVNESATIPASLDAEGRLGRFLLNLSTKFGEQLWLAEPRWDSSRQGPLPIEPGDEAVAGGAQVNFVAPCPGIPRLWFIHADRPLTPVALDQGRLIHYGYVPTEYPLVVYQTLFSRVPGSSEMPSAARPITSRVREALVSGGVQIAPIVLHTGVSSLELESPVVELESLYPEPFAVPKGTAQAVNLTRAHGGRVIAVGTTVVRALESAWTPGGVREASGYTRVFVHPGRGVHAVDGLLTGLHDPVTSHLAMLAAIAGMPLVRQAYAEAIAKRYLWHEFGDSHLILLGARNAPAS